MRLLIKLLAIALIFPSCSTEHQGLRRCPDGQWECEGGCFIPDTDPSDDAETLANYLKDKHKYGH